VHCVFFAKYDKNQKFSGFNANGLEIKQRVQRGMAFFDLIISFVIAAKKLHF